MDGPWVGHCVRVFVGATLVFASGCRASFTGPYPCETDYASCLDPSQNTCETNTASDALNCGACGHRCGVGALCVASSCGPPAVQIAQLSAGSGVVVKTNSSSAFWSNSSGIFSAPMSAGAGTAVTTLATDGFTCNNLGIPFAVDDANYYYLSNGSGCVGSGPCGGLTQVSLASGTRTVLVSASTSGGSACGSIAVGATSVYLLTSQQQSNVATYTLFSALIGVAGQTASTLASVQSINGPSTSLAINSTALFFFSTGSNSAQSLQIVPINGGMVTALPVSGFFDGPAGGAMFADEANVYTLTGGCPCSGDNNQPYTGRPLGGINKTPLAGGPTTTIFTFSGALGGIAVDSADVYWSTDTTAWKVPLTGGKATALAGNLTGGVAAYQCNGCNSGGSAQTESTAVALGASGLYIGATGTENELLRVAK